MKKIFRKFILISLTALTLLSSCSNNKGKEELPSFNFNSIDSIIKTYDLEKSIGFINEQKGLSKKDSLKLMSYKEFLITLKNIESKIKKDDDFVKRVIDFQNGIYDNKVIYADSYNENIYSGSSFLNANICLVNSTFLSQTPQDLVLSVSYDDKYYNNIFTDFSMVSDNKTIKLSKSSPANGFNSNGDLKGRPFKFKLNEKEIELLLSSEQSKIVLTTAMTYNDRAYLKGTIWDIKSGEPIKYNEISTFKERKAQILEKGKIKQFEIIVKPKFKERLKELNEIHKILKNNNIK